MKLGYLIFIYFDYVIFRGSNKFYMADNEDKNNVKPTKSIIIFIIDYN